MTEPQPARRFSTPPGSAGRRFGPAPTAQMRPKGFQSSLVLGLESVDSRTLKRREPPDAGEHTACARRPFVVKNHTTDLSPARPAGRTPPGLAIAAVVDSSIAIITAACTTGPYPAVSSACGVCSIGATNFQRSPRTISAAFSTWPNRITRLLLARAIASA